MSLFKFMRLSKSARILNFPSARALCNQAPNIDYTAIAEGNAELEHKLKVIVLESDVLRQDGGLVPEPEFLNEKHWKELLTKDSYSARKKYLQFLFKIAKKKENRTRKKEEKAFERLNTERPVRPEDLPFEEFVQNRNLGYNHWLLRVYDTTMNNLYNHKLIQAMQFGQKLVVDCGFESEMTLRENQNCAKQLMLLFAENRQHDHPFDLQLCNIDRSGVIMKAFSKFVPTLEEPWFPLSQFESSYLDLFPKENLVYLTPHCREVLKEYDHDATYIIGGIVDKTTSQPLSMAKAKREGIKMAKLPMDRYLAWGAGGGKSLTLNQMISILLDIKSTNDWNYALRHVPRRKIIEGGAIKSPKFEQKVWRPKTSLRNLSFNPQEPKKPRSLFDDDE